MEDKILEEEENSSELLPLKQRESDIIVDTVEDDEREDLTIVPKMQIQNAYYLMKYRDSSNH